MCNRPFSPRSGQLGEEHATGGFLSKQEDRYGCLNNRCNTFLDIATYITAIITELQVRQTELRRDKILLQIVFELPIIHQKDFTI